MKMNDIEQKKAAKKFADDYKGRGNEKGYMEDSLSTFPYVNGGLFDNENIEIPKLNEKIVNILLENASTNFDWSEISPTIFGAVFESTLNPRLRRIGGMHYTSIENIHKVINPLFLDNLYEEFKEIKLGKQPNVKIEKLLKFQEKLSQLTFFDPAAEAGIFSHKHIFR
jgi:hypothetical protein